MAAIVFSDASPLIALARVNGLLWLQQLFTAVVVTDVVRAEVLTGRHRDTEAPIQQALAAGWLQVVAVDGSEPALLLIDERAGRAVAHDLGLSVAGTAGDVRIAPGVIQAVLDRCGE